MEPTADGVVAAAAVTNDPYATSESLGRRMLNGIKRAFSRVWSAFRSGVRWLKDKVVSAAGWVRDKTVSAYRWTRDRVVKPAISWVRENAGRIKDKALAYARRAWSWTRATATRLWAMVPYRRYLASGVVTGAVTGFLKMGWVPSLIALGVVFLLLRRDDRRKAKPSAIFVPEAVATRELSNAQELALDDLANQYREQAEAAGDVQDKAKFSEFSGGLFAVQSYRNGSEDSVTKMAADHRKHAESVHGIGGAAKIWTWSTVRKGMSDALPVIAKTIDEHAPVVITA